MLQVVQPWHERIWSPPRRRRHEHHTLQIVQSWRDRIWSAFYRSAQIHWVHQSRIFFTLKCINVLYVLFSPCCLFYCDTSPNSTQKWKTWQHRILNFDWISIEEHTEYDIVIQDRISYWILMAKHTRYGIEIHRQIVTVFWRVSMQCPVMRDMNVWFMESWWTKIQCMITWYVIW